jgi:integrase
MARKGDGIYKRGGAWRLDFVHNGKRHVVSLGRRITRTAAAEIAQVKRAAILKGELGIGGKKRRDIPFETAAAEFLTWAAANKRPKTATGYKSILTPLKAFFGGKMLSDISPFLVEKYKQKRLAQGRKVAVNRELSRLRTLFNLCIAWKKFEGDNPARRYKAAPESRGRYLSDTEETALLEASTEPLRTIIQVGIHAGLRVQSEALSLTWPNVDLKGRSLTVEDHFAKNGETRSVPLNSVLLEALGRLRATSKGSEHVFLTHKGEPLKSIRTAFDTACEHANLSGVTPHVLRHTFASRLVMRGADLRTVMELGGWKNLSMVQRYSHLSQAHKLEAVELLAKNSPPLFTPAAQEAESSEAVTYNVVNMMGR